MPVTEPRVEIAVVSGPAAIDTQAYPPHENRSERKPGPVQNTPHTHLATTPPLSAGPKGRAPSIPRHPHPAQTQANPGFNHPGRHAILLKLFRVFPGGPMSIQRKQPNEQHDSPSTSVRAGPDLRCCSETSPRAKKSSRTRQRWGTGVLLRSCRSGRGGSDQQAIWFEMKGSTWVMCLRP